MVDKIFQEGIMVMRTQQSAKQKITRIESNFCDTVKWLQNTGKCITCEESLQTAILSKCWQFYDLEEVMLDRATTRPLFTNKDYTSRDNNSSATSTCHSTAALAKRTIDLSGMYIQSEESKYFSEDEKDDESGIGMEDVKV